MLCPECGTYVMAELEKAHLWEKHGIDNGPSGQDFRSTPNPLPKEKVQLPYNETSSGNADSHRLANGLRRIGITRERSLMALAGLGVLIVVTLALAGLGKIVGPRRASTAVGSRGSSTTVDPVAHKFQSWVAGNRLVFDDFKNVMEAQRQAYVDHDYVELVKQCHKWRDVRYPENRTSFPSPSTEFNSLMLDTAMVDFAEASDTCIKAVNSGDQLGLRTFTEQFNQARTEFNNANDASNRLIQAA
jgi:hypothetical protein